MHEAARTSTLTGGEISTRPCRSRHVDSSGESARTMPNEPSPPEVRASARNSSRQSPRPVQMTPPLSRGEWVSALKLEFSGGAARGWCIMVHQLGVPHPSMPHQKIPVPSHVPGDTRGHGRWTATTRKRQCDGIGTVRWEGAMQTPSRSRTPGARKTTSKTCGQASRRCRRA